MQKKRKRKHTSQSHGRKLVRFLSKRRKELSPLLILTHDYPDPDALAAAYALQYLADKAFSIQSRIVYKGIIGREENRNMVEMLKLPVHRLRPWELQKYSQIALVDTQPRFENNPFPEKKKAAIVIDQHPPVIKDIKSAAELALVDKTCGATSIILAQALLSLNIPIPERVATSLAYGILTDTLNLYRARRPDIVKTYLKVLSYANMHTLARIQTPVYDAHYFNMLARGISQARYGQGMLVCHLGRVTSPDSVSQMADFLLSYKKAKWALTSGRYKSKLHVSLRTMKMDPPAAELLRKSVPNPEDAGGHGRIAGGSLKVSPNSSRQFALAEKRLTGNCIRQLHFRKKLVMVNPF